MKEGDIILSIAEKEIKNPQDVKDIVTRNPGVSMLAVIERNGRILKKFVHLDIKLSQNKILGIDLWIQQNFFYHGKLRKIWTPNF